MKSLSLSLFTTVYISIIVFGIVLSLKSGKNTIVLTPIFVLFMLVFTMIVQNHIHHNFITPSGTLPLARARLIDIDTDDLSSSIEQSPKENTARQARGTFGHKGMGSGQPALDRMDSFYLYRQPELNKLTWETAPRACTGLEEYCRMDKSGRYST